MASQSTLHRVDQRLQLFLIFFEVKETICVQTIPRETADFTFARNVDSDVCPIKLLSAIDNPMIVAIGFRHLKIHVEMGNLGVTAKLAPVKPRLEL